MDAAHWRDIAQSLRTQARKLTDPQARDRLLAIAEHDDVRALQALAMLRVPIEDDNLMAVRV